MNDINKFEKYLLNSDKSDLTVQSYLYDIQLFVDYINANGIDINNITIKDIRNYKALLFNQGKKISTINRNLVSVNHYLEFHNVNIRLKQEKVQTQNFLDDILTTNDIKRMIELAEAKKDYRAKAIFCTLFYTGMRVSEMLQLTPSDIESKEVLIRGKGHKYREVFIPKVLKDILRQYLQYRVPKSDKLFTGQKGAITRQTVHRIIKSYAEALHIEFSKAHAHSARHLYGKRMSDKGVDIDTIADLLGHVNINITRIYTRKTKQELLDIVNEL